MKRWIGLILLVVFVTRVMYVNVRYNKEYPMEYCQLGETVTENGVQFSVANYSCYKNFDELLKNECLINVLEDRDIKEFRKTIEKYEGTGYYLIAVDLKVRNTGKECRQFFSNTMTLAGDYWCLDAHWVLNDRLGVARGGYELSPGETYQIKEVFFLNNVDPTSAIYDKLEKEPLYMDCLEFRTAYRFVLQS